MRSSYSVGLYHIYDYGNMKRQSSGGKFAVIHLPFKKEIAIYASIEEIWIFNHDKAIFFE